MIKQFHALALDRQHALAAYPLVYLHDASMTRTQWRRLVGQRCRRPHARTGLMAIHDARGIIHALFSYRVDHDLRVRTRLCIADLIVAHVAGSQIDAAVAAAARSVSAQFGCQAITIERPFGPSTDILNQCPTAPAMRLDAHATREADAHAPRR
jgi:hypothetical protein